MVRTRRGAVSWSAMLVGALAAGVTVVVAAVSSTSDTDPIVDFAGGGGLTAAEQHPITIVGATPAPGIPTGDFDRQGNPILANCTTCHATRTANSVTRDGTQLNDFHQGLTTAHGELACVSCHNPDDYSQLRLASGEGIEFADSLRLCAQCHGPQFRDYENGAHGGMTGHWDLAVGPRVRNHCLACHDAHAPKYQQVMPVFAPREFHAHGNRTRAEGYE